MFTTGLQGIHDTILLEMSKNNLLKAISTRGGYSFWVGICSEIITTYGGFWLVENAKLW